jgi:hypothetical protein
LDIPGQGFHDWARNTYGQEWVEERLSPIASLACWQVLYNEDVELKVKVTNGFHREAHRLRRKINQKSGQKPGTR